MSASTSPHPNPRLAGVSRWRAASIHLLLSAFVGTCVLALMLLVWYPGQYFRIAGGSVLVLILVGVDVGLGPLITLIVFDPAKRWLKLDLAFIATVQLVALAYGSFVMFEARPVYAVFVVDQFDVVTAIDLDKRLSPLPVNGPQLIAARLPDDPAERRALIFSALNGVDVERMPQYWIPYADARRAVLARAKTLAEMRAAFPVDGPVFQHALVRLGRSEASLRVVGVRAEHGDALMLIDATTAEPLLMVDGRW